MYVQHTYVKYTTYNIYSCSKKWEFLVYLNRFSWLPHASRCDESYIIPKLTFQGFKWAIVRTQKWALFVASAARRRITSFKKLHSFAFSSSRFAAFSQSSRTSIFILCPSALTPLNCVSAVARRRHPNFWNEMKQTKNSHFFNNCVFLGLF